MGGVPGEKGQVAPRGGSWGRCAFLAALVTFVAPAVAAGQQVSPGTRVGGGVYLFHYQPVELPEGEAKTEVYAAFLDVGRSAGSWRVFVQARGRDTRLREFFPGNVWLQEAWASYGIGKPPADAAPVTLRAGKMYQTLGRFWDGSFFGNVHYFDGLKLNPQFGLEAAGVADLGAVSVAWSSQLLLSSDRISGAFPGRDFETLDGFRDRWGVTGRVAASLRGGVTVGLSALSRRFEGPSGGPDATRGAWRALHVALDAEARIRDLTAFAEVTTRRGGDLPNDLRLTQAGSRATYWLAGARYDRSRAHLRYNFSLVDYLDLDRREWIHQPGVTVDVADNVSGLLELDLWRVREPDAGARTFDRSLNFVLLLRF